MRCLVRKGHSRCGGYEESSVCIEVAFGEVVIGFCVMYFNEAQWSSVRLLLRRHRKASNQGIAEWVWVMR